MRESVGAAPRFDTVESWDRWASTYEETGGLFTRINDDWIVRVLPLRGARVLDVGCGTGRLARKLAQEAREVLGIDTSPGMIEQARRQDCPNTRFQVLPACQVSPEEPFDVIVAGYLLHHLDEGKILAILQNALLPGGTLMILEPLRGSMFQRMAYVSLVTRAFGIAFTLRLVKARFTSTAWKDHGRGDRLPSFSSFRELYAGLLPGADIRRVHALFGAVLWRKPR